jgi:spermidine synthase
MGYYQVVDTTYDGRDARVLYTGETNTAQSGIPRDGRPDMLFDYNQRFYELIECMRPGKVLIIGGGAGTLGTELHKFNFITKIDIIEPNSGLTRLAYEYFGLPVDERLRVHITDGRTYLKNTSTKYDIIVLDAFNQTVIPPDLRDETAFDLYKATLTAGGALLANIISTYHGVQASPLKSMVRSSVERFTDVELFRASVGYSLWLPQNFVLVARDARDVMLQECTRGIPIDLP